MRVRNGAGIALLLIALAPLGATGCSSLFERTPAALERTAAENEQRRTGIARAGVSVIRTYPELVFRTPAKGAGGGAIRGAVAGAAIPVVVGIVTPIPLGTFFGLMAAPVGAAVGAIWGAAAAPPAAEIEASEAAIDRALTRLSTAGYSPALVDEIVRVGNARTPVRLVGIADQSPDIPDPADRYNPSAMPGFDAVIEIEPESLGLDGFWTIDPPSAFFLELTVRLIRLRDEAVLYEDTIVCRTELRSYAAWAAEEGRAFEEEAIACRKRIAEKIVDDLLLLQPLEAAQAKVAP